MGRRKPVAALFAPGRPQKPYKQDIRPQPSTPADAGVPPRRAGYPPASESGPSTSSPTSSNSPTSNPLISSPPTSIPRLIYDRSVWVPWHTRHSQRTSASNPLIYDWSVWAPWHTRHRHQSSASGPCKTALPQAASVACKFESALLKCLSGAGPGSARCQFWTQYDKTACMFDKQFVGRLENGVDISMLFAGLFSAVNTAFIIAVQSDIVAFSTSNTAMGSIVNAGGLVSSTAWTAALSYASLSASLLSAFGALLAKQWLAHFKATRSTHGSLPSRGMHRQRKFDAMQNSYFSIILDCVPILLEVSLLLFAISLLGNTWYPYQRVAGVILAATAIGVTLYFLTFFAALLSPDSPFQTLPSQLTKRLWKYLSSLSATRFSDSTARNASSSCYLRAFQSDSKLKMISLSIPTLSQEAPAVRWLLQTSTDPDVVTAVARMVPEVDWPVDFELDAFVVPLLETFKNCFKVDSNDIENAVLSCSNPCRAYTCSKALVHLYSELLCGGHGPDEGLREDLVSVGWCLSSVKDLKQEDSDQFTFMCGLVSLVDGTSGPATVISVPEDELSWVSHIIPAFLQSKEGHESWTRLAGVVIPRISKRETMVSKVLANYWVTIGLISGMQINAEDLVKVDKSSAIDYMRESVCGLIKPGSEGDTLSVPDGADKHRLVVSLIRKVLSVEEERKMIAEGVLSSWDAGQWPSASSKQSSTSTLVAPSRAMSV